jgi:predicted RNA-binding protein with RPS1 domain
MASEIVSGITSSSQLKRKMHLKGTVVKTNQAGAIVDIGVEKSALLHVSQIAANEKDQTFRVEDYLKDGQEVEVYVRNVDDDRIEVSMKEPLELEWRDINKDMVVKGKVTALEKFGAFVEIGAERPALVHVSELTHGYVRDVSEVVSVGDEIEAKVIEVNRRKKQIKLSMKAMQPGLDEIEGVTITPARRGRKPKGDKKAVDAENNAAPAEKEPTVMEIALRAAMEKTESKPTTQSGRAKKAKETTNIQDDILARTLNSRS